MNSVGWLKVQDNHINFNRLFRPNLTIHQSLDGRLEFSKSNTYKITYSILSLIIFLFLYLFLPELSENQQSAFLAVVLIVNWYIWLKSYVDFDSFLQTVTIRRGLSKIFKARVIPFAKIKEVYVSQERLEKSYETQFFFHLKLNNGDSSLLFYYDGTAEGEKAFVKLKQCVKLSTNLKRL